ncbi:MAG: class I SAM-dependent methyltransferase [Actinobacteria bacterium]|nr:class I SAM-dependent methyltransferase [Thermoleophilia bacterium]MCB9010353.1 class I SAM-dependent methyltransferase [Actinomycetota bacterium]
MLPGPLSRKIHHARAVLHARASDRFDRRHGTDTVAEARIGDLTVASGDAGEGRMYVGSPPAVLEHCMPALVADPATTTFIDMGSGKGRALMLAAVHGFPRAIGVEFAEELHAIALRNRDAFDRITGLGERIEPCLGDAGAFAFPPEPLMLFFNNPFRAPVLRRVLDGLQRSLDEHPRPAVLLYQSMKDAPPESGTDENLAMLDEAPFLTPVPIRIASPAGRFMLAPFALRAHVAAAE